jgi:hypothetical protein
MTLREDWLAFYGADVGYSEQEPRRSCVTVATNQLLMERHPRFRGFLSDLERETQARLTEPTSFAEQEEVTIPVVVHVLWNDPGENISDGQIASQIDVLNEDFAAVNGDRDKIPTVWAGLSQDSGIRFKLAGRDPSGTPHSGITRTKTDATAFRSDDSMKFSPAGADAWDPDRYLNIWVCNLTDYLGYAQFPGGPPSTDGVVIRHSCFGRSGTATAPFDLGRTATHEVGHWLNLRHIWGDTEDCSGSDFVDDTPKQRLPNYDVPTYPSISCGNAPHGDMFVNYMDYVNDAAMHMFTAGQVVRMRTALYSIRAGLLDSPALAQ